MRLVQFIAICVFFCHATLAQEPTTRTGTIKGVLIDEKTQEPIPGVTIIFEGARNLVSARLQRVPLQFKNVNLVRGY